MPDSPPMTNIDTKPSAKSNAGEKVICSFHRVPSQLNTFTALGSAIMMVDIMKVVLSIGFMPDWNMWWPYTTKPRPVIAEMA